VTAPLPAWPDAELVVLDLLDPVGSTVLETGDDIPPGTVLIQRVGGADDGITDRPVMQIVCFHGDRSAAWSLARNVQQRMLAAGGTRVTGEHVTGVLIDSVRTVTPPDLLPDRNPNLRPVAAQYRLGMRRQFS
jgi:hypothetical protein